MIHKRFYSIFAPGLTTSLVLSRTCKLVTCSCEKSKIISISKPQNSQNLSPLSKNLSISIWFLNVSYESKKPNREERWSKRENNLLLHSSTLSFFFFSDLWMNFTCVSMLHYEERRRCKVHKNCKEELSFTKERGMERWQWCPKNVISRLIRKAKPMRICHRFIHE